nr:putative ribonuclease H-like domain-containing protein [Tanacetum cinerariifolium]
MRMEQYITHTDYALWEVIVNGDAPASIASDAKTFWEAIKTRFRGNKESKKIYKTILKQQYENFAVSRSEDNEDPDQIYTDDLEEMDLKWQYDQQREILNKANLEIIAYQLGLESLEARIVVHQKNEAIFEDDIAFLKYDVKVRDNSITELKNQLEESLKEKDDLNLKLENQLNERDLNNKSDVFKSAFDSSVKESEEDNNQENDMYKAGEGYHGVPPPYTGNFMPSRPDMSFAGLDDSFFKSTISETITSVHETETSASKTSKESMEKPKSLRPSAHVIEDWESDSDDDCKVPVNTAKQSSPRAAASTSTARYINIGATKPTVNVVSVVHENGENAVKSSACWIWRLLGLKDFMKLLLLSVLFTKTECLVLSPDFKLLDENQVLLKVPRHNNMYSFDLKNVAPLGGLTCLFAKAIIDESNLLHRRLGHINFKTMNKLVRGNLVRGLPSKIFEINHTCVACQKGKQHKASRGPEWLFDIDSLTKSMNYEPVTAGNQTNDVACIEINVNARQARQEKASDHE